MYQWLVRFSKFCLSAGMLETVEHLEHVLLSPREARVSSPHPIHPLRARCGRHPISLTSENCTYCNIAILQGRCPPRLRAPRCWPLRYGALLVTAGRPHVLVDSDRRLWLAFTAHRPTDRPTDALDLSSTCMYGSVYIHDACMHLPPTRRWVAPLAHLHCSAQGPLFARFGRRVLGGAAKTWAKT